MIDFILVLTLLSLGGEMPAQSGKSSKSPTPAAPASEPAQDGERPALSAAELKLLKDTNIFAPRTSKRPPRSSRDGRSRGSDATATPAKPKPPVVTGIFFDAKVQTFLVVVEDRNSDSLRQFKEPKFLKAGDEVVGYRVASVTAEKAVFVRGEISKELKVGESMPGADGKPVPVAPAVDDPEAPLPEGEEKVEIKPQDAETNSKTLEEMKKKVGKKNRPSRED
jgi:hypothetical protein